MPKDGRKTELEKLCSQSDNYFFGHQTLIFFMVTNFRISKTLTGLLKNGHL